jgi:arylsulfatase A-like enzyme
MEDWLATLMAAVGQPDIKAKLLQGHQAGTTTYKVHLDGYDQTDVITGKGPTKRQELLLH